MVGYGQWISFLGVFLMVMAIVLSGLGLAAPWWVGEGVKNEYPVVTEASLWVSATTWYDVPEAKDHFACTGACDRTKVGRVRLITSCKAWSDFCPGARTSCGQPPGPAPFVGAPAPPPPATPPPAPPPPTIFRTGPTLPPPGRPSDDPQGLYPTTTITYIPTTTRTFTTTTVTTRTTPPLTPLPMTTRQMLRPTECSTPTDDEFAAAEYTAWELAWTMDYAIIEAIYYELNHAMTLVPIAFIQQRATVVEQVRLFWEVLVGRNAFPLWLWQYERDWCPSAPAEALHYWLTEIENKWTLDLALQAMKPPTVTIGDDKLTDGPLKEAWEIHVGLRRTTPAPDIEEGSQPWHVYEAERNPDAGLPDVPTIPPQDKNVVVKAETPTRYRRPPQMTFASCQKAFYEGEMSGPTPWQEALEPCGLKDSCNKIWAIRAALLLQLLFGLFHTAPSCLSFIGAGTRFGVRFPPELEMYLAGGSVVVLLTALGLAFMLGMPEEGVDPPLELSGFGFSCGVAALVCCLGALVCSKMATGVAKTEKVLQMREEEKRANPIPVKTSLRHLPDVGKVQVTPEMMGGATDDELRLMSLSQSNNGRKAQMALPPSSPTGSQLALTGPTSPTGSVPSPTSGRMIAWGTKTEMQIAMQA